MQDPGSQDSKSCSVHSDPTTLKVVSSELSMRWMLSVPTDILIFFCQVAAVPRTTFWIGRVLLYVITSQSWLPEAVVVQRTRTNSHLAKPNACSPNQTSSAPQVTSKMNHSELAQKLSNAIACGGEWPWYREGGRWGLEGLKVAEIRISFVVYPLPFLWFFKAHILGSCTNCWQVELLSFRWCHQKWCWQVQWLMSEGLLKKSRAHYTSDSARGRIVKWSEHKPESVIVIVICDCAWLILCISKYIFNGW